MNEWEFTAEVASWINETLQAKPTLPFSRAKCEQRGTGSLKRRDLTLLDKNKSAVLTGEVKLPYAKDGHSPLNDAVVRDARSKAQKAGAHFFFTWNVNEFVLWETYPSKEAPKDQQYKSWRVTLVHKVSHLEIAPTHQAIKSWLSTFLEEFAQTLRGTSPIGIKPLDEKFINMLESALHMPIMLNFEELLSRYSIAQTKNSLDKWMREEQGWTILDDEEGIKDNLERASKFACYALLNKLVFHEALLKRYGSKMDSLKVPKHIDTADTLRLHLEGYFGEAKIVTGDYETVFGEDHTAIGNLIPFFSDSAVFYWRILINEIHKFDFSKLDYEVIGGIFERLISPEERHKYGQFYTRVEVVDLINSFCIRDGDEKVMDPACGGGTFLVRAYARKRELNPARRHGQLLSDLFGVDISHFATHLTTINLATRDLVDDENYPQIARSDFFDISGHKVFLSLPRRIETKGLGKIQRRKVEIPPLDAIVGNPPYVRQEDIPKAKMIGKHGPPAGTKEYYLKMVKDETGIKLSGRSDLHCFFWPHSASFLKDDGHLCLLTSSQWLDVEYGFRLQDWILSNFKIVAIFESIDEPWFVGARVATTVTILKREPDEDKRMSNIARFVQLRRPIKEILPSDGLMAEAVNAANRFRDEILLITVNTLTDRYRARLVKQKDLWDDGVKLGMMMNKAKEDASNLASNDKDEAEFGISTSKYFGGKWGVHLRAPDLWFHLLDKYGENFIPLGSIANIHRGITSGKDVFFFPEDDTATCLNNCMDPTIFMDTYGVSRHSVLSGKVKLVSCGDKRLETRPIESAFLEPELHSLMNIKRFSIGPEDCTKVVLLVDQSKNELSGSSCLRYIRWGESQQYHKNPTCKGRATDKCEWYDLTRYNRPDIILPKIQQYRLIALLNPDRLHIGSSLLGLYDVHKSLTHTQCAILNSTIAILSRLFYARGLGNEGNIQLDVYSANMMLVPNLNECKNTAILDRINKAFAKMISRDSLMFLSERRLREMNYLNTGRQDELNELSDLSELDMMDRHELDDAVLELLGVDSPQYRRELNEQLYTYLREYFEYTRQKEEKAIINKNTSKHQGRTRPIEIASQVQQYIIENEPHLLYRYEVDFIDRSHPFDTFDIPMDGIPETYSDMFIAQGVKFMKGPKSQIALIETSISSQAELITLLAKSGTRGLVRIPHDTTECVRVLDNYRKFISRRDERIQELIRERTADEDTREKVLDALMTLIVNH